MSEQPLRVFIGVEQHQWLPAEVLRNSIVRRTKGPVEFHDLKHITFKAPITFAGYHSLYRFLIPELCGYSGKVIYLSGATVVNCDLLDMLNLPMNTRGALARRIDSNEPPRGRNTDVMLLDCGKLKHWKVNEWIPHLNQSMQLVQETIWAGPKGLVAMDFGDLPREYNEPALFTPATKILYYNQPHDYPWKVPGKPNAQVFLHELKTAIMEDSIPLEAVKREIAGGHVYADILKDMGM